MAQLLYHWDFTNSAEIDDVSGTSILDKVVGLEAKIIFRGTDSPTDKASMNNEGIFLNNGPSGSYCIDLSGLDSRSISGDISLEMVLKNKDITRNSIYFQSISDGLNSDSAHFTFKNNGSKTLLNVRTDKISESTQRSVNIPNTTGDNINNINDNEFFHYVFTIKSETNDDNEIKIYINHSTTSSNTASLDTSLSGALRQSNLIGTQKNPENATYLHGVVKYIKLYEGILTDSAVETLYENYIGYGNICFLGSEKVETDQGKIRFNELTIENTIFGKKIKKITKVYNYDSSLIFIHKNALGKKIPSVNTYISRNHGVYLDKKFIDTNKLEFQLHPSILDIDRKYIVRARNLIKMKSIIEVHRSKRDLLYNVILEEEGKMVVNGIICETLSPASPFAKRSVPRSHLQMGLIETIIN
jgi:hypothetical protein